MKIVIAYKLRPKGEGITPAWVSEQDVESLRRALEELKHVVSLVEVSEKPHTVVEKILESNPDLIFNVAEGTIGGSDAFYPGLYEQLGVPYTGGNASLLHLNLDKHLAKTVAASRGIAVPTGVLITKANTPLPKDIRFPLIIKSNNRGAFQGISQGAVVHDLEEYKIKIDEALKQYTGGVEVEEFIPGKELSIPFLEAFPGKLLGVVEHVFDLSKLKTSYNIHSQETKNNPQRTQAIQLRCPAQLSEEEEKRVLHIARQIFSGMKCPDFGRVDIRLHENGTPYFLELNPLPSLNPAGSLMAGARFRKLEYKDVVRLILRSAARRYHLGTRPAKKLRWEQAEEQLPPRPTARELGITIGRFQPGTYNAITDVKGVKVGHATRIEDEVQIPGTKGTTCIRTGVTAILPASGNVFERRLLAGGFVLNGVGEMSGLTQVMEWGWMETPILLTNTMSVGKVHSGIISYMARQYPHLGTQTDVVIPVVGETDDSFLNDVRVGLNGPNEVSSAIANAKAGTVLQGSLGAGTGMITCDFAGGIGSSSRVLMTEEGGYTLGVLVLSNFGRMRNLTIEGKVVGRELDEKFTDYVRRTESYGSIIVVVATDAPLLSSQLSRISKRAALALGRVGSHAASTSGEIIIAFSTANRLPRHHEGPTKYLNLKFISDQYINPLYEATIEATEEAIINSIFCSNGMNGRENRIVPAIPHDRVLASLKIR